VQSVEEETEELFGIFLVTLLLERKMKIGNARQKKKEVSEAKTNGRVERDSEGERTNPHEREARDVSESGVNSLRNKSIGGTSSESLGSSVRTRGCGSG